MSTSGDVLADYVFGFIGNVEPEGVFINRSVGFRRNEGYDLLVSTVSRKLYSVMAAMA